jgi:hypothetical protein
MRHTEHNINAFLGTNYLYYYFFISKKEGRWRTKKSEHDRTKLPVIAFGTEIKGKNAVKFKGHRVGVVDVLSQALRKKDKRVETFLLRI